MTSTIIEFFIFRWSSRGIESTLKYVWGLQNKGEGKNKKSIIRPRLRLFFEESSRDENVEEPLELLQPTIASNCGHNRNVTCRKGFKTITIAVLLTFGNDREVCEKQKSTIGVSKQTKRRFPRSKLIVISKLASHRISLLDPQIYEIILWQRDELGIFYLLGEVGGK